MHRPTPNALIAPPDNQVHREQYDATLVTKGSTVRFLEPRASNARKEHFKNNFKNPVYLAKPAPPGTTTLKPEKVRAETKVSKNQKIATPNNTWTIQTSTQRNGNARNVPMVVIVLDTVDGAKYSHNRATNECPTTIIRLVNV